MKPPIWQVYDWLQTESAYPNGPLPAATCHVARALRLGMVPPDVSLRHALLIGPGTSAEVGTLSRGLGHPLHVLVHNRAEFMEVETHARAYLASTDQERTDACWQSDMHDMPWSAGYFDLVFSSNVLEHAFSPYGALLEIRRVLREGGVLYSVIPTWDTDGGGNTPWHVHCLDLKQWRQLHHWAGFAIDMAQVVHEPSVPAEYFHIRARAVVPPPPHDEVLRRLVALTG